MGGYPSYCSNGNNSCQFQFLVDQTPVIISVVQHGLDLNITGDGFSSTTQSNTVLIGDIGLCRVTDLNTTTLLCTITSSPSGRQVVRVNVDGKGYASSTGVDTVIVPLTVTSFEPNTGASGGGYLLAVYGIGFSLKTIVTLDGNTCTSFEFVNSSMIRCIVPPARTQNTTTVMLSIEDNGQQANASSLFVYNTTSTLMITSISPRVVTMAGGVLNITGTGIGNNLVAVFIGVVNAPIILTSSSNLIQLVLPKLPPGLYTVRVETSTGFAQSPIQIEYQFYIQQVIPQIVSLYGGTDVYLQGKGLDTGVTVNFRDQTGQLYPCEIVANSTSTIHCRTVAFVKEVTITVDGVHPTYGLGFAWSPRRQTVEQGTIVTWNWSSSQSLLNLTYNVQELANAYSTEAQPDGFSSGSATSSGTCSLSDRSGLLIWISFRIIFVSIQYVGYFLLLVTNDVWIPRHFDAWYHQCHSFPTTGIHCASYFQQLLR